MKAINHGGGHRGWLIAITAVSSVLILAMALFLGGCGGSDQGADSGSQLDEGAENSSDMQGVGSIGGAPGDEGQDGSAGGDSGAAVGDSGTGDGSVSQGLYGPEGPLGDGASSSGGSQSATPGTNNGSPGGGSTPPSNDPGATGGSGATDSWNSGGIEIVVPPAP